MKSRRITAVLLVFSLCLCLAVSAQAASHKHNWIERSRTEATCTQDGRIVYVCSCGEKRSETIPALGHHWDGGTVTAQASCEKDGVRTITCTRCGKTKTESIPASGHQWDSGAVTVQPSCEKEGVKTITCGKCGKTKTESIPAAGHKPEVLPAKEATCEENGLTEGSRCTVCGAVLVPQTAIPAVGHSWGPWQQGKLPTCEEKGKDYSICANCGGTRYRDDIEPLGHDWDDGVITKEPAWQQEGEITYTCKRDPTHTKTEVIPALEEPPAENEYDWEPPELPEEPDEPEEPEEPDGGPGAVSPASGEPSALYSISVEVEDTSGWLHSYEEKVPVKIRITNTGSEPLYIGLYDAMFHTESHVNFKYHFWDNVPYGPVEFVKNYFYFISWDGENQQIHNYSICARHAPGETSTLTIGVPVIGGDINNDAVIRTLDFWFVPEDTWEASPSEAYAGENMPDDWPWPNQRGSLVTDFSFGLQPVLKTQIINGPAIVGGNWSFRIFAINAGSRNLFNWEGDIYKYDKNAGDYVFYSSFGKFSDVLIPESNTYYYSFSFEDVKLTATEQMLEDAEDGLCSLAVKLRSWTKDGETVESGLFPFYAGIFDVNLLLEAEDTSAGQVPEEDWVKVKLKVTNLGTEVMTGTNKICWNEDAGVYYPGSHFDLKNYDMSFFPQGTSEEAELWIQVLEEDKKAGEVRRKVQLEFYRLYGEGGRRVYADTPPESTACGMRPFDTNEVEVVIPLLEPEPETPPPTEEPSPEPEPVSPPPAEEPSPEPEAVSPPPTEEPRPEPVPETPPLTEEPRPEPEPEPQPLTYCVPRLADPAKIYLLRCPKHYAIVKAAAEQAEQGAWEEAVRLWTDALNAEYDEMLAGADEAGKAVIEEEKACFSAYLAATRLAVSMENPDNPALAAEKTAALLMHKTSLLCCLTHASPAVLSDVLTVTAALPAESSLPVCGRQTEAHGASLQIIETLCPMHQALAEMHADADDAEGWKQIRLAWLEAMNRLTDIRYLGAGESGKTSVASSRTAFGGWLQSFDKLLRLLVPDQPAAAETFLTGAIRDYVLETCPGFYPETE